MVKSNLFAKSQLITLHYLLQSIQMWSQHSSLGTFDKVIVHQSGAKPFAKAGRSKQYLIKEKFRQGVFDLFEKYNVDTEKDRMDFIQYLVNDIQFQRKRKREAETGRIIEDQLDSLSLSQRNNLIKMLTHKPDGEMECLNDDMLAIFPSLRKKSVHLLNQNERKEREDKIDLQFVDEFMHDHCR